MRRRCELKSTIHTLLDELWGVVTRGRILSLLLCSPSLRLRSSYSHDCLRFKSVDHHGFTRKEKENGTTAEQMKETMWMNGTIEASFYVSNICFHNEGGPYARNYITNNKNCQPNVVNFNICPKTASSAARPSGSPVTMSKWIPWFARHCF